MSTKQLDLNLQASADDGPWCVGKRIIVEGEGIRARKVTMIDVCRGDVDFETTILSGPSVVCRMFGSAQRTEDQMLANAALISRAPQLLESLAELVDWMRDNTSPREDDSPHEMLVRAVHVLDQVKGAS